MKWWGYLHVEGSLQIKRYFDEQDLQDARDSSFCAEVSGVVEARDREEAITAIVANLGMTRRESSE